MRVNKKKWISTFKFIICPIMTFLPFVSLSSCTTSFNLQLNGGSLSLTGTYGISGQDSKQWKALVDGQQIKSSFSLSKSSDSAHFNVVDIWINDAGIVNWSNKILPGKYSFYINSSVTINGNTQSIKSKLVTLSISSSEKISILGGSSNLNGEHGHAFHDANKWYCTFDGQPISNYELSLFSSTPIPSDIFIENDCVNWSSNLPVGKYNFCVKGKYTDQSTGVTYEDFSQPISLNITKERELNITPGTLNLQASFHSKGNDTLNWKASLPGAVGQTTWSLVPLKEGDTIPDWLSINKTTGCIEWSDMIDQNISFKVKVDFIDNLTQYEYSKIDEHIVNIECLSQDHFHVNFKPNKSIVAIENSPGSFMETGITALLDGNLIQFSKKYTKVEFVDENELAVPGLFVLMPENESVSEVFLRWNSSLVPGIDKKVKVKIEFRASPYSSLTYIGYSQFFDFKVYHNFYTDSWENFMHFAKSSDFKRQFSLRYGVDTIIGLKRNISIGKLSYDLRIIGCEEDYTKYDDKTKILSNPAHITFEFENVISEQNTREGESTKWNTFKDTREFNFWHIYHDDLDFSCQLRLNLIDKDHGFYPTLPQIIKDNIVPVYKGAVPCGSDDIVYGRETLFLLGMSEYNLKSTDPKAEPVDGIPYSYYFYTNNQRKYDLKGQPQSYWFRTTDNYWDLKYENLILYYNCNTNDIAPSYCDSDKVNCCYCPAFCI